MSYTTNKATFLTNVGTDISSKVTTRSISPTNVGGNTVTPDLHGIAGVTILTDDLYSLISAAGDFQSVLTTGNIATDIPARWDSATPLAPYIEINNSTIILFSSTGVPLFSINRTGGGTTNGGTFIMKDATTSYYASLLTSTFTADRAFTFPDESGNLVTHTTKDAITVSTGGNNATFDQTGLLAVDSIGGWAALNTVSGVAQMLLKSASVGFTTAIKSNATATGNRSVILPDEGTGSGLASTLVTHTTKDAITVTNGTQSSTLSLAALVIANGASVATINSSSLSATNATSSISLVAGTKLRYTDIGSTFVTDIEFTTPTANRTITAPNVSGTLMLNFGGNSSQALVAATTMVIPHGLGAAYRVVGVVPKTAASGVAMAGYYATTDATNLTIHFAAPVTATVDVDYQLAP